MWSLGFDSSWRQRLALALTDDWMGPPAPPRADSGSVMTPASSAPNPPPSPPASDVSFSGMSGHIARLESVLAAGAPPLGLDAEGLEADLDEEEGIGGAVVAVEGGVEEVADLVLPTEGAAQEGGLPTQSPSVWPAAA